MVLARYKVELSNFAGSPGVNVWHFANSNNIDADIVGPALQTFYAGVNSSIASGTTIVVPTVAELINEETGELEGFDAQSGTNPTVTGTGSGAFSRATQIKVQARTSTVRNGRLIQGGVFLGPAGGNVLTAQGEISGIVASNIVSKLDDLVADLLTNGTEWVIYSRPTPARVGAAAAVTSYGVWNIPGAQRNRRV